MNYYILKIGVSKNMEKIFKKLKKVVCEIKLTSIYVKIEIRNVLNKRLRFVIYCNFNRDRNSYSYIDFRKLFGKNKEIFVSKKELYDIIDNFIKNRSDTL